MTTSSIQPIAPTHHKHSSSHAPLLLVVDDEPSICWGFERLMTDEGFQVMSAGSAEKGLKLAAQRAPDLIVCDVRLPGMDGIQAVAKFRELLGDIPIVVITAFGDLETAVAAIREGATDYLTKPFRIEDVVRVVQTAMQSAASAAENKIEEQGPASGDPKSSMVGSSPAMQYLYRQIAMVADSNLSVLITGETGTGKELIAKAIHQHSSRAAGPYVPVAPVALNPSLIESELFGHVRGAFTGAGEDRDGLFALASGGTLLLDEIGDLPMSVQVKLLRVLEQREYTRVGDTKPRPCNVRILAATNADLRQAVAKGGEEAFRRDLYFRLAAVEIHAPPLRDRLEDVQQLAVHFLRESGIQAAEQRMSSELITELRSRDWFGNVRELRNAIEHAAVVSRGQTILPNHLPRPIPAELTSAALAEQTSPAEKLPPLVLEWARQTIDGTEPPLVDLHERFLSLVEPALLEAALEKAEGNRAAAASLLGIHRGTLRERLRRHGLDRSE